MANPQTAADDLIRRIHAIGDNTSEFTAEESLEFYEAIASDAEMAADAIREEMT